MSEAHKVSKPSRIYFIVMDGRADFDLDAAQVFETYGDDWVNYERVWFEFEKVWRDWDARLVAYKILQEDPRILGKAEIIRSLKDLEKL